MQGGETNFAQIIVPSPLKQPLTYAVPPLLQGTLQVGMRVLVPLGRRKVTGVVADFLAQTPVRGVREILTNLDDRPILDPSLLRLIDWASHYYLAPLGEVLATFLPPQLRARTLRVIVPKRGVFSAAGDLERKILAEARRRKGRLTISSLTRRMAEKDLHRALDHLSSLGAVEVRESIAGRKSANHLASTLRRQPAPGFLPKNKTHCGATAGRRSHWRSPEAGRL
ncbi:MAG: hypothetical protein HYY46_19335 [Deltaproteobacteria bacterium]|nr:hypothetical protein [Deltaproteobacteria bacterium]